MREHIDLNGTWLFVPDLDPKYHRAFPYHHRVGHDRRNWQSVQVPGVWNHYATRYEIFEGVCWFAREFVIEKLAPGTTARLRFGGVNYHAEVFVNGERAGAHEGGYTEFVIDVSRLIKSGTNLVCVRVDNRSESMRLPAVLGYFNYGGIHRDVRLELHESAYFEEIAVDARPSAIGGEISLSAHVAAATLPLRVTISCSGSSTTVSPDADGKCTARLSIPDAKAWSPESPSLHPLIVELRCGEDLLDRRELRVGFRAIAVDGFSLKVNGNPIHLHGTCYVYDCPDHGLTITDERIAADFALFKHLGVNAIRSHFPMNDRFLDACDRAGLMVWIEPPVYCVDPKRDASCANAYTNPAWLALALSMCDEMVRQSRNHPSVCLYGIGNECDVESPGATEFFAAIAERVRKLDATRLIGYACLYGVVGKVAELVDVIGINEYWGWYDVYCGKLKLPIDLSELEKILLTLERHGKPLLVTEFGADAKPGMHCAEGRYWSQEYQAILMQAQFSLLAKHPAVAGTFPFVFADYRDPSKEVNAFWDGMNYKGVVSYDRERKLAFKTVQAAYADSSPVARRWQVVDPPRRHPAYGSLLSAFGFPLYTPWQ